MPTAVPYPTYDEFFLLYNQLRRRLDVKLKHLDLTLTGLQILTLIEQAKEQRFTITRSSIAATLGLTDSTLSTAIKGLTAKGFVREKRAEHEGFRNQPLQLEPAGRKAMHSGLVVRHDVLEEFDAHMPSSNKAAFFEAARLTNASIKAKSGAERVEKYMKSLSKRPTRQTARRPVPQE